MTRAETTVFFIRHAQSSPSYAIENSRWPLSPRGYEQAEALADLLPELGIEFLYCSNFLRCRETIAPFAAASGLELRIEEDLRERLISDTLIDDFPVVWERSWEDRHFKLPGCESSHEAETRFLRVVTALAARHPGRTLGACTHGNVLGLFLRFLGETEGPEGTERLRNPDLLSFTWRGDEVIWNRDFHLPGLDEVATHHMDTPVERRPGVRSRIGDPSGD